MKSIQFHSINSNTIEVLEENGVENPNFSLRFLYFHQRPLKSALQFIACCHKIKGNLKPSFQFPFYSAPKKIKTEEIFRLSFAYEIL